MTSIAPSAQRFNVGTCPFGIDGVLAANAANLPEVLGGVQGRNPARLAVLKSLVHEIFPDVHDVTVEPLPNSQVQILAWFVPPEEQRHDLAIPLGECGDGLGQALAILYVVVNTDTPGVILIDEPASFLHPGATRKLIEILVAHPQHQYIIARHQPTGLLTAVARTTHSLVRSDVVTVVRRVSVDDTEEMRSILADVGTGPSDVFGYDRIVWVEGATEEVGFELIVADTLHRYGMFECYLLHDARSDALVSALERRGGPSVGRCDAAAVLKDVFSSLAGGRIPYDKVRHGPQVVRYLLDNDPAALDEVRSLSEAVLSGTPSPAMAPGLPARNRHPEWSRTRHGPRRARRAVASRRRRQCRRHRGAEREGQPPAGREAAGRGAQIPVSPCYGKTSECRNPHSAAYRTRSPRAHARAPSD
jgi:hypothetical protein